MSMLFACTLAQVDPVEGVLKRLPFTLTVHFFLGLDKIVVEFFSFVPHEGLV